MALKQIGERPASYQGMQYKLNPFWDLTAYIPDDWKLKILKTACAVKGSEKPELVNLILLLFVVIDTESWVS